MARDNLLASDLAALADDERRRLGEPPTLEQLAALRDGELPEDEADRLRARLAVDPESAELYLELERFAAAAGEGAPGESAADVDEAWRELSARLERGDRSQAGPASATAEVIPFHRRTLVRVLLGLAATVLVAVGVGWWIEQAGHRLPDGEYYEIPVTEEKLRDATERVPAGIVGLAFQIDLSGQSGSYDVELLDATDRRVRAPETFEAGQQVVYRVARRDLVDSATYRLYVRRRGETSGKPALTIIPDFAE